MSFTKEVTAALRLWVALCIALAVFNLTHTHIHTITQSFTLLRSSSIILVVNVRNTQAIWLIADRESVCYHLIVQSDG